MMPCNQCYGKGASVGTTEIQDPSFNTVQFHTPVFKPQAVVCTQCRGNGYITGGSF